MKDNEFEADLKNNNELKDLNMEDAYAIPGSDRRLQAKIKWTNTAGEQNEIRVKARLFLDNKRIS